MSNQVARIAVSVGLAFAPLIAWAQSPSPAPLPGKIGVINIQAAIANTAEGKKAFAEIDKKYAPRKQELQDEQAEITNLTEKMQKQGTTLSDDEQRRLQRELQEKQTRFKRAQDDAQAEFSADSQDIVNRIGQKLVRLLDDYAQQNGYAVVIEGNPQLIYFVAPQVDLTEEMVKRYDAANPSTADASTGSSTSGAAKPAATRPPAPKPADKPKP